MRCLPREGHQSIARGCRPGNRLHDGQTLPAASPWLEAPTPPTQLGGFLPSPGPWPPAPGPSILQRNHPANPRQIMLKVVLPDGSVLEFSRRVRPIDIAAQIGPRLAKATLAAEVDGQIVGADATLPDEGQIRLRLLTARDPEALDILRHSCAHVMARAVMRLFEGVQLAFGPTVDNGFYYDFQMEHTLSEEDFPRIEAEMARIVAENEPFERVEMDAQRGPAILAGLGSGAQGRTPPRGPGRRGQRVALSPGRVRRSVPGAAPAGRRGHRGLQTPLRRRRLLERRRPAAAVAAALWHRLVHEAGPRRLSAAGGRGQAPRSSRAGQATGAVPHRSGRRLRAGAVAAQGGGRPPATGKLPLRRVAAAGISAGLHAGDRQRPLVRGFRPFSLLQGQPVPAHRVGRGRARTCCGR